MCHETLIFFICFKAEVTNNTMYLAAHPKCVLFLTHGGLLSQHETIHSGVPVVVIPHVFDQHRNAKFIEEKGVGISIDLNNLTYLGVLDAIKEVLYDKKLVTLISFITGVIYISI